MTEHGILRGGLVITLRRSVHHQTRPSIVTMMGVTIEQHAHNGRLIRVHVSTLRATRRCRTFPGSITVDPTEARFRLSLQQVRELTGIKPPAIAEEQRWQEIFRQLEQIDPAIIAQCVARPPIPRTRMRSLIKECRTHKSLNKQASWAQQLTPTKPGQEDVKNSIFKFVSELGVKKRSRMAYKRPLGCRQAFGIKNKIAKIQANQFFTSSRRNNHHCVGARQDIKFGVVITPSVPFTSQSCRCEGHYTVILLSSRSEQNGRYG
jgi:hypothetical protein